jgi:hypothetical protein
VHSTHSVPTVGNVTTTDHHGLLERLEAEILEMRQRPAWARYLAAQARFHRYSPRNVLLISLQAPEATSVAGYGTWRSLGRQVRRGERGISILAPLVQRDDALDPRVIGFRWVKVFDVAQTDGAALPSPVSLLEGTGPVGLLDRLEVAAAALGFRVERGSLRPGVNGECRWARSTIVLEAANGGLQQAKTLAHELGHVLLHRTEPDRSRAEVEAEAVAYVVLAATGADAAPYSAGYLSSWIGAETDPGPTLARSMERIQRAASRVLSLLAPPEGAEGATSAVAS